MIPERMEEMNDIEDELSPGARDLYRRVREAGLFAEEVFRGSSWTSKMVEEVRDIIGRRGLVLPGDYDCVVS